MPSLKLPCCPVTACVCYHQSNLGKLRLCQNAAQWAWPLVLQSKPSIVSWNFIWFWLPCVLSWGPCERWVYRNLTLLTAYMASVKSDCSCIWLILNEAQAYYNTSMGSSLEAPVKDGVIQKFDNVHRQWHSNHITRCNPVLNLKVGKLNYCLGHLTPQCAKRSKNLGNFSRRSWQKDFFTKCVKRKHFNPNLCQML